MFPFIEIGSLTLPTYFVWNAFMACLVLVWGLKWVAKNQAREKIFIDLFIVGLIAGVAGGRLGHLYFESTPDLVGTFWDRSVSFWQGGFVYLTGLFCTLIAIGVALKLKKQPLGFWLDLLAPVIALFHGLGRISCFLAGCCYGRVCDLPWAFKFPYLEGFRHPTQIYLALGELFLFFCLLIFKDKIKFFQGSQFLAYMILASLLRLFIEPLRDDFRGELWLGLSVSSHLSLVIIATGVSVFLAAVLKKKSNFKA